ncbi:MAG: nucleotidyltransferase family protein [Sphingobacteriia bacterium]|nr:MAG: nucleotidyltransferase family protein [Sphingobacteriia bacterium]
MKAMIFAAGLGSRLKPWTDHHPKALAMVQGKSLLQRNILYLQQYGITEVVVNVHHFAHQIIAAVAENKGWGSNIIISDESDEVLETGGGLKKAAAYFASEENILVMNADILTNMALDQLMKQHLSTGVMATLAVSKRETSRYFLFNEKGNLCGWENRVTGAVRPEALDPLQYQPMAFSGIQVLNTRIFSLINRDGKFSMVDIYLDLCRQHSIQLFDHTGAILIDVGKPESLAKAASLFI